ncbi:FAD-dependent oxidoreductase [Halospina sp. K52047b]|uniref:NAD(P)/FAD-dependent oxidoreductase n=1 Tax=Halospina sp. K52047b TaxID=2614160 RepID=UPI00124AD7F3|nr:FAD-dependent oxidoreductase [Halospina sp. K52047b]KAA8981332.1 FAD-dependent oxidoreductase [Halospina sp. K52047b]
MDQTPDIAIIGAGIAGLTAALRASEAGLAPLVFEKSRGPGGRLASKRTQDGTSVDMGAQFFTVRNPRFRALLADYAGEESFGLWDATLWHENREGEVAHFHQALRHVGVPRMTAITRALADGLPIQTGTRITALTQAPGGWWLETDQGQQGPFPRVIITAPPEQARDLLPDTVTRSLELESFGMLPCWSLALRFGEPLELGFDGMQLAHESLGWVARNASKPERGSAEWWVLHANSTWSATHRNADSDDVAAAMTTAFRQRFDVRQTATDHLVHRWLYARPAVGPTPGFLSTADYSLGLCGDWLAGGRVEGAFESADALAATWFGQP